MENSMVRFILYSSLCINNKKRDGVCLYIPSFFFLFLVYLCVIIPYSAKKHNLHEL